MRSCVGLPFLGTEGGRGAKILFRSPCWAIMRQYHPTMCPYRAALFVPRPHHARTTPHRRDQASVLHGGCELKGHLCDLGTQALVSCGIAQSTRRRYGRGRQPKQPEHHAAAARLTHLTATIRTHASEMSISSVDSGHLSKARIQQPHQHLSSKAFAPASAQPNPTQPLLEAKKTHRTNAKP